jgi:hypothetical protein
MLAEPLRCKVIWRALAARAHVACLASDATGLGGLGRFFFSLYRVGSQL